MKNGPQLYDSKTGTQKHRVRLREGGQIIATNGEGHLHKSQCDSWPLRTFKALWKYCPECRAWIAKHLRSE